MLTLKEFMDCQNSFETETEYGEPQHWVYLKSGRSIEVTYEDIASVNFISENHAFTIRYHCSEKEFDDNDFHGTNGVIEAYCYTKPDMALQCIYNIMRAYHEEESED